MPSIKKNIAYQSAYQLLIIILPLILAPYISRVLGAENIGIYSYTLSIASYFAMFAMLGIGAHGNRTIAAVREDERRLAETFSDLLFFHVFVSLVVIVAYAVFVIFADRELKLFYIIQSIVVLSALLDVNWLFMGLEQFRLMVIRNMAVKLVQVICVFAFIRGSDDLWMFILIMALGTLMNSAVLWLFIGRFVSFVRPTWTGIKHHVRPLLVLFIPAIAISVYKILSKIMLGAMTDHVQLGFYDNSEKIVLIPMGFIIAFNMVMIPRMSNLGAKEEKATQDRLTLISMKYVMMLAFAMAFGIAAIANGFAPLFFGEEFRECGPLIAGMCVMLPFLAFSNLIAAQYLIPHAKDAIYTTATVGGAVLSVAANLILVPRYQAMGAVAALVLAEVARCAVMFVATRKALPIWTYVKNGLPFLFMGVLMYALLYPIGQALGESVAAILSQVGIGAVFYLVLCVAYLYVTKDVFFMSYVKVMASKALF